MSSGIFSFLLFLRSVRSLNTKSAFSLIRCGIEYPEWLIYATSIHKRELSKLTKIEIVLRPKHGVTPPPHDDDFFVHQTLTIPPVMPLFLALNVLLDEESSWFLCQTFSDLTLVGFSFLAEKYMCLKLLLLWHGARQKLLCGYVCEKPLSQKSFLTDNHFAKKNSKKWVKKCWN